MPEFFKKVMFNIFLISLTERKIKIQHNEEKRIQAQNSTIKRDCP